MAGADIVGFRMVNAAVNIGDGTARQMQHTQVSERERASSSLLRQMTSLSWSCKHQNRLKGPNIYLVMCEWTGVFYFASAAHPTSFYLFTSYYLASPAAQNFPTPDVAH